MAPHTVKLHSAAGNLKFEMQTSPSVRAIACDWSFYLALRFCFRFAARLWQICSKLLCQRCRSRFIYFFYFFYSEREWDHSSYIVKVPKVFILPNITNQGRHYGPPSHPNKSRPGYLQWI